jgi:hypothetical protein
MNTNLPHNIVKGDLISFTFSYCYVKPFKFSNYYDSNDFKYTPSPIKRKTVARRVLKVQGDNIFFRLEGKIMIQPYTEVRKVY